MTAAQRDAADQARRETVEQLHRQLADNVARMDDRAAWERLLRVGSRLHRHRTGRVGIFEVREWRLSGAR